MTEFKETSVDFLNVDKHATFCSSETKWINKILKLHESHPDEVEIVYAPEDNDGMLVAHLPKNWLKISPPRKVNYTDEQRAAAAKRMSEMRTNRNG